MAKQIEKLIYDEYFRKSSEAEDKQAYSIPDQMRDVDAIAKKESLTIGIIFPGESQSAFTIGRPIFARLVKNITHGKSNAILVWHPNRLARNPVDAGMILWLMDQEMLKEIKTPSKVYRNTASDKFMLNLEFSMSKKDSDDKSEVVKRALIGRAKRGLPHGLATVGFINDRTKEKGNRDWIKDLVRYPMVKQVLKRMLTGLYTGPEIYLYAKDEIQLTTMQRKKEGGKPIAYSYIYTLLRNPIYAGFFFQNTEGEKVRYEATGIEPMITEEEYWKIQDMLGRKGISRVTNRKAVYDRFCTCGLCDGKHCTDFKFQVICPACKKKFSYLNSKDCPSCGLAIDQMKKPTFLKYVFYYCLNNKQHRTICPGNGIEEKNLEAQLISNLEETLAISKELSAWCVNNIAKVKDVALEDAINFQKNLEQKKSSIDGQLKRLTLHRISRDCNAEENIEFDKLEKELKSKLSLIEIKLSNTNVDWLTEARKDFILMSEISDTFRNGTVEKRTDTLFEFRSNLAITAKKVKVTHKKSIEAIKSCLLVAHSENKAFEPKNFNKIELNNGKTELFDSVCPTLLRR